MAPQPTQVPSGLRAQLPGLGGTGQPAPAALCSYLMVPLLRPPWPQPWPRAGGVRTPRALPGSAAAAGPPAASPRSIHHAVPGLCPSRGETTAHARSEEPDFTSVTERSCCTKVFLPPKPPGARVDIFFFSFCFFFLLIFLQ